MNTEDDKHVRSQEQLYNMQDDQKLVQDRIRVLENQLKQRDEKEIVLNKRLYQMQAFIDSQQK